jgi:hypothetical protein
MFLENLYYTDFLLKIGLSTCPNRRQGQLESKSEGLIEATESGNWKHADTTKMSSIRGVGPCRGANVDWTAPWNLLCAEKVVKVLLVHLDHLSSTRQILITVPAPMSST